MRNYNILYCPTNDCVKTFLSEAALENDMLLNSHSYSLTFLDEGETTDKKSAPEKVALEKILELMGESTFLLKNAYV